MRSAERLTGAAVYEADANVCVCVCVCVRVCVSDSYYNNDVHRRVDHDGDYVRYS